MVSFSTASVSSAAAFSDAANAPAQTRSELSTMLHLDEVALSLRTKLGANFKNEKIYGLGGTLVETPGFWLIGRSVG